jgi:molybdenum cofactor cytidylyltransferase
MPGHRVGAIVLAAGSSSRLGTPKQLLHFRGESLLRRAARAALGAGCAPVVVVTGANAELSRAELADLDVRETYNGEWTTGLASSIRTGVAQLLHEDPDVAAVILMLCDQPHVTAPVLSALIAAHDGGESAVVASHYGGAAGAPALFVRALFPELAQLAGAAGAKQVIARHATSTHLVVFPGGEADVDTPADLARLRLSRAGDPPEWAGRGSGDRSRDTPHSRSTPPRR